MYLLHRYRLIWKFVIIMSFDFMIAELAVLIVIVMFCTGRKIRKRRISTDGRKLEDEGETNWWAVFNIKIWRTFFIFWNQVILIENCPVFVIILIFLFLVRGGIRCLGRVNTTWSSVTSSVNRTYIRMSDMFYN